MAWGKALWGGWGISRETSVNSDNWNWRLRLGWALSSAAEEVGPSGPGALPQETLSSLHCLWPPTLT